MYVLLFFNERAKGLHEPFMGYPLLYDVRLWLSCFDIRHRDARMNC